MGIGLKIKEYRNKAGLTQKDLADKLHVTYQAVSRWENDDAEPSFDTLRDMCIILNCSTNDLFELTKPIVEETKEEPVINDVEITKEPEKKLLGMCEQCTKSIYDFDDLVKYNETIMVPSGRGSHSVTRQRTLCKECNEIRLLQEKRVIEKKKKETERGFKIKRIHSLIWPTLVAVLFLVISIVSFVGGDTSSGVGCLITAILGYTFLGCMILNNTFITDLWMEVASWGFVRMPGIIFSFSLDGLIFLIVMKVVLFILGILLAIIAFVFATILAMALSIFVYPFALRKNIKEIE